MRSKPSKSWIVVLLVFGLAFLACGDDNNRQPPPFGGPPQESRINGPDFPCYEDCQPSTVYKAKVFSTWFSAPATLPYRTQGEVTISFSESGPFVNELTLTRPADWTSTAIGTYVATDFFFRCEGAGGRIDAANVRCPSIPDIAVVSPAGTELGNGAKTGVGSKDLGDEFPYSLTLKNTRNADLIVTGATITATENCNATAVVTPATPDQASGTNVRIRSTESATLTLTITPTAVGTFKVTIAIASNDPDESPFTAVISGQVAQGPPPAEPEISVLGPGGANVENKAKVASGEHAADVPFSMEFTVKNTGTSVLSIFSVDLLTGTSCSLQRTKDPDAVLPATTGSTTFVLGVTPTGSGSFSCPVSIDNDDTDEHPFTFEITGTITAAPDITVSGVANIPDGSIVEEGPHEAEKSFDLTYKVTNAGAAPLAISDAFIPVLSPVECAATVKTKPPGTLAPGASGDLVITVTPSAKVGPFSFSVNITSNDPQTPFGFGVQGTITNPCAHSNPMKLVEGKKIYRVPTNVGCSGDRVCRSAGLTCAGVPVLNAVAGACLAFHPGTTVKSDLNGWQQSVYCDGTKGGLACNGEVQCHDCPQCGSQGLQCNDPNSSLLSELYVECK